MGRAISAFFKMFPAMAAAGMPVAKEKSVVNPTPPSSSASSIGEAMKMNTLVTATTSGSVSTINVGAGDMVEEGQALLSVD